MVSHLDVADFEAGAAHVTRLPQAHRLSLDTGRIVGVTTDRGWVRGGVHTLQIGLACHLAADRAALCTWQGLSLQD